MDDGGYESYSEVDSKTLEDAFKDHQPTCTLNAKGKQYEIDFGRMEQNNVETKFVRKVKRMFTDIKCKPLNPGMEYHLTFNILPTKSKNYKKVESLFDATMKGKYKDLTITHLINSHSLYFYKKKCCEMNEEAKKHKLPFPKLMDLFHGSHYTDPALIYNGYYESFDAKYANAGLWGKGIYFAVNASYSNNYSFVKDGVSHMLMARVIVGTSCDFGTTTQDSLIHPPPLPEDPIRRYDSVKAHTGGSDVYVIYEENKASPKFLITYRKI